MVLTGSLNCELAALEVCSIELFDSEGSICGVLEGDECEVALHDHISDLELTSVGKVILNIGSSAGLGEARDEHLSEFSLLIVAVLRPTTTT